MALQKLREIDTEFSLCKRGMHWLALRSVEEQFSIGDSMTRAIEHTCIVHDYIDDSDAGRKMQVVYVIGEAHARVTSMIFAMSSVIGLSVRKRSTLHPEVRELWDSGVEFASATRLGQAFTNLGHRVDSFFTHRASTCTEDEAEKFLRERMYYLEAALGQHGEQAQSGELSTYAAWALSRSSSTTARAASTGTQMTAPASFSKHRSEAAAPAAAPSAAAPAPPNPPSSPSWARVERRKRGKEQAWAWTEAWAEAEHSKDLSKEERSITESDKTRQHELPLASSTETDNASGTDAATVAAISDPDDQDYRGSDAPVDMLPEIFAQIDGISNDALDALEDARIRGDTTRLDMLLDMWLEFADGRALYLRVLAAHAQRLFLTPPMRRRTIVNCEIGPPGSIVLPEGRRFIEIYSVSYVAHWSIRALDDADDMSAAHPLYRERCAQCGISRDSACELLEKARLSGDDSYWTARVRTCREKASVSFASAATSATGGGTYGTCD